MGLFEAFESREGQVEEVLVMVSSVSIEREVRVRVRESVSRSLGARM
jgi:hypothetical protein